MWIGWAIALRLVWWPLENGYCFRFRSSGAQHHPRPAESIDWVSRAVWFLHWALGGAVWSLRCRNDHAAFGRQLQVRCLSVCLICMVTQCVPSVCMWECYSDAQCWVLQWRAVLSVTVTRSACLISCSTGPHQNHPDVTQCSWQDAKIQLLTNLTRINKQRC